MLKRRSACFELCASALECACVAGKMWTSQRLRPETLLFCSVALFCFVARPFSDDGPMSCGALVVPMALGVLGAGVKPNKYVRGISDITSDLYTLYFNLSLMALAGLLLGASFSKLLPRQSARKHKRKHQQSTVACVAHVLVVVAGWCASSLAAVRAFGLPSKEVHFFMVLFHTIYHLLHIVLGTKTLCCADAAVVANVLALATLHAFSLRYAGKPGCFWESFSSRYFVAPERYLWHASDATAALFVMAICTSLVCLATAVVLVPAFPRQCRRGTASLVAFGLASLAALVAADRWFSALRVKAGLVAWGFDMAFVLSNRADCDEGSFFQGNRPLIIAYWAFCLAAGGCLLWIITSSVPQPSSPSSPEREGSAQIQKSAGTTKTKKLGRGWRKFFHFLSVVMFVPVVATDMEFFRVASGVAVCVMVAVEAFQCVAPKKLASPIARFYALFVAHQDGGIVTLTHISLLVGLALPTWLDGCAPRLHWLSPYSGFVCIGVADSFASLVGAAWGKHRWGTSPKTVEGTLAGMLSAWAFSVLLWATGCGSSNSNSSSLFPLLDPAVHMAIIGSMLVEAFTKQIDNLILPLHFYLLLNILPSKL